MKSNHSFKISLSHYYVKEISKNRNQQTEQFTDIFLEKSLDVKVYFFFFFFFFFKEKQI